MPNKFYILLCFLGFAFTANAQSSTANDNIFYLNVFINANKTIYVEEDQTSFQNVQKQVAGIL
ncbi:hypothetical protein [Zunongwangia pacifica]|uniref:Uncharacterized protein n=1 Tax=Zunongwangia pacifica TaxID=2911062 RepID=A0A9X1ZYZ6_9FLAO|nr:hypothetical protein [Zunongwangia pacifica]MCL6219680.1 hypothetical protein [Zunongwangia pacifica]